MPKIPRPCPSECGDLRLLYQVVQIDVHLHAAVPTGSASDVVEA
jgi:hypothetical protein